LIRPLNCLRRIPAARAFGVALAAARETATALPRQGALAAELPGAVASEDAGPVPLRRAWAPAVPAVSEAQPWPVSAPGPVLALGWAPVWP
jgi:hypothetical protein